MDDWRNYIGMSLQGAKAPESIMTPHVQKMGWKDHMSLAKEASGAIALHVGNTLAQHLTSDPAHQKAIAGAISQSMFR